MPLPIEAPQVWQDLVSIADIGPEGVYTVLKLTASIKARPADFRGTLAGKQIALFFEKPSLRTRLTFEAGIASLGGQSFFFDQTQSRLGAREKLSDVAHNLERWIDGIVLRTFEHSTVLEMAQHANIPVINALSELEHPCQALADYFTLIEKFGDARKTRLAYVGDGNNVAHSLLLTAASLGAAITVATPVGFDPQPQIVERAFEIATETGAMLQLTHDADAAIEGADAVYTDVWASMGQESQHGERQAVLPPFQVNKRVFAVAARHAVFRDCWPARRGR